MKSIIIIITLTLSGCGISEAQDVNAISSWYMKMKDAMIMGDAASAGSNAGELIKALRNVKEFDSHDKVISSLARVSKSGEIEKQRKELAFISPIIWNYLVGNSNTGQPLYYQYCPMKKSYWISSEPAIRNPYYGNKMLDCGNVADSLK